MDRVRIGRALGAGARQAAKSLVEIADAAASPNSAPPARRTASPTPAPRPAAPAQTAPRPTVHAVAEGSRRFKETFMGRLSRLGGALWLEMTGVFFGIFALVAIQGVWRMRYAIHAGAPLEARQKLFLAAAVALAFSYFCVSSFIRARRRERGHHKRR